MRRMADRRGLDPDGLQSGLGGAADRDQPRAVHLLQEAFENMQVLPDHAALGQAVRERPGRAPGMPGERVPEKNPLRSAADRIPHHAPRRLQPQRRIPAGGAERKIGSPGEPAVVRTAKLALAGERDPGEASTAEPESLAEKHQPRPAHPLQISLQVAPPLPRAAGLIELRVFVPIGIANAGAFAAGALVQPAEEGWGGQNGLPGLGGAP